METGKTYQTLRLASLKSYSQLTWSAVVRRFKTYGLVYTKWTRKRPCFSLGCSVVDYCLVPKENYNLFSSFEVTTVRDSEVILDYYNTPASDHSVLSWHVFQNIEESSAINPHTAVRENVNMKINICSPRLQKRSLTTFYRIVRKISLFCHKHSGPVVFGGSCLQQLLQRTTVGNT